MYLLLVFLPLLGTVLAGGFGRFLGFRGGALITTSCVAISFLCSMIAFYEVGTLRKHLFCQVYPLVLE